MPRFILLLFVTALCYSCANDFGKKTVTYTKGNAIYGDLAEFRATPLLAHARDISDPGKIFVYNDLILVGEEGFGIHILDNSDPNNPAPVSFLNIPGNKEYYVSDGILYAESMYDMLQIDVSNMHQPLLLTRIENAFMDPIYADDGLAVVGFEYEEVSQELALDDPIFEYDLDESIYYYDLTNSLIPQSAVPASFAGNSSNGVGSVNRIVAYDGYVYAVSREKMNIFQSNDGFEQVFSEPVGWGMETVFPMGNRLFVGSSSSVDIYDISNRDMPVKQTSYSHMTSCDPVLPVDESTAYVTLRTGDFSECPGDNNALLVLDVGSVDFVEELQEIVMESPFGMTLIGDELFVGEGASGLKVFDASNRRSLVLKESVSSVAAYDVMAHPNRSDILLIAAPDGLIQYQLDTNFELLLVSNIKF